MAVQKKKAAQPAATQQQRGAPPVRLSSSPLANINPKVKLHATTLLEVDSRRWGMLGDAAMRQNQDVPEACQKQPICRICLKQYMADAA
jgi:hypothetical protein